MSCYLNRLQRVCISFDHSDAGNVSLIVQELLEETPYTCNNCPNHRFHPESTRGVYDSHQSLVKQLLPAGARDFQNFS